MDEYTKWTFTADRQTSDFLTALKNDESVNLSGWLREAIRAKAGLTGKPMVLEPAAPKS